MINARLQSRGLPATIRSLLLGARPLDADERRVFDPYVERGAFVARVVFVCLCMTQLSFFVAGSQATSAPLRLMDLAALDDAARKPTPENTELARRLQDRIRLENERRTRLWRLLQLANAFALMGSGAYLYMRNRGPVARN
jgi:hypothetical protein